MNCSRTLRRLTELHELKKTTKTLKSTFKFFREHHAKPTFKGKRINKNKLFLPQ